MVKKEYEIPQLYVEVFEKDVLTFSAEPEDEKTSGDIFED